MFRSRWSRFVLSTLLAAGCADPAPPVATAPSNLGVSAVARDATGLPSLVVAAPAAQLALRGATPADIARGHVARLAPMWRVDAKALPDLRTAGEVAVRGGTITRLAQEIEGLPVLGELRVMTRPNGELVAVNGTLVGLDTPRTPAVFRDDEAAAIAYAVEHTHQATDAVATSSLARRVWIQRGTTLVAAWAIDAYSRRPGEREVAYRTIFAGADRTILSHESLTQSAPHRYRVYSYGGDDPTPADAPFEDYTPHPTGVPDQLFPEDLAPTIREVDGLNHPAGSTTPDPWLAAGATATTGNNADVYLDLDGNGIAEGRALPTNATFDFSYDLAKDALFDVTQQRAVMTQLFYTINYLHDFWYDAGFTEAAGNGQQRNFGRGGVENDRLVIQAQSGAEVGSSDNARMSTPADGLSPTMFVFIWSPGEPRSYVNITPSGRTPEHRVAKSFGPTTADVSGQLVVGADGAGADPDDGCEPLTTDVTGKIVLLKRVGCAEHLAAFNAQQAGAIGVLFSNTVAGAPERPNRDPAVTTPITIPSYGITKAEGDQLRADVAGGTISVRLRVRQAVRVDGGLDSTVIAHEFGHYVHHRLQQCGNTGYCGALSEGWGDVLGMLLEVREGDDMTGAFPLAPYAYSQFANSPYFGLRRLPYSTGRAINDLRFRHMRDGAALPPNPKHDFGISNSEVHNAGEIWATAMFEVYAALIAAHPGEFEATKQKMAQYIVAGLLLAPANGTATEVRDALLAAMAASDPADAATAAAALASRGFGTCAESGSRDDETFSGVVDGDTVTGRAAIGEATVTAGTSCDQDAYLDAGESATVVVPITNIGTEPLTNVRITAGANGDAAVMGEAVTIATLAPHETQMISLPVTLAHDDLATGELIIDVATPDSCATTVSAPLPVRLNVDTTAASSATDRFNSPSVWTTEGDAWQQIRVGVGDSAWHSLDPSTAPLSALISPELTVPAGGSVSVDFTYRYAFSERNGQAAEGGVIEISVDGGATWKDINSADFGIDPYDGIVGSFGTNLAGRRAFTGQSPGYPDLETLTLDFGTRLAGKTFQLRFRTSPVQFASSPGWLVDDVAFTGITGTPFPGDADETGDCPPPEPADDGMDAGDGEGGGCCQTQNDAPAPALLLGALALGTLVVRRRRR